MAPTTCTTQPRQRRDRANKGVAKQRGDNGLYNVGVERRPDEITVLGEGSCAQIRGAERRKVTLIFHMEGTSCWPQTKCRRFQERYRTTGGEAPSTQQRGVKRARPLRKRSPR